MTVFDRIDKWLDENGVSRRKLAIKAKLPPSSLQSALTRRKKMSFEMLDALARAMQVSVDYLMYGSTEEDLAFEALEADLAEYGFSIMSDDSDLAWCYIFPSEKADDPTFIYYADATHIPISVVEFELGTAVKAAELAKKQYVTKRIQSMIDSNDETSLAFLQHIGDV